MSKNTNKSDYDSIPLTPLDADKKEVAGNSKPAKGMMCSTIKLLDGTIKKISIEKNATGADLFNAVCDLINLVEKDYFSLSYLDKHDIKHWLMQDKTITKQLPRSASWKFAFEVKFYPTEPTTLAEEISRFQLGLQIRNDILSGKLPCSFMTYALLGALMMQATTGDYDYSNGALGYDYIKDVEFAPNQSEELLDRIYEMHKDMAGKNPNAAERQYLTEARKLAMYGIELHRARDSDDLEIMLGVCSQGLHVYRDHLRINRFTWAKIIKFSYKRNNFYVRIRAGEYNAFECTIGFKLDNHKMAKRLWKIAVEYHAFFRLREVEEKATKSCISGLGPNFQYIGRTMYQAKQASRQLGIPNDGDDMFSDRGTSGRSFPGHQRTLERFDRGNTLGGNTTERSEIYKPKDSKFATLDIKNSRRRQDSVPFAEIDDDINNTNGDEFGSQTLYNVRAHVKTVEPGEVVNEYEAFPDGDRRPKNVYGKVIEGTKVNEDGYWCSIDGIKIKDQFGYFMKESDSLFLRDQYGNVIRNNEYADTSRNDEEWNTQEDSRTETTNRRVNEDDFIEKTTVTTTTTTRTTKNEHNGTAETISNYYEGQDDQEDDDLEDEALSNAILSVTNINHDLAVHKIEIQTNTDE